MRQVYHDHGAEVEVAASVTSMGEDTCMLSLVAYTEDTG